MSKKIPNPIDDLSPFPDIVDLMYAVTTTTPRGSIKGYWTETGYYKASTKKKKQSGYRDSAGYWHSGKKR